MGRSRSGAPFIFGGIALVCGLVLALAGAGPFADGCDFGSLPEGSTSSSTLSVFPPGERCEYVTPRGETTSSVTIHWEDLLFAALLATAIGLAFWPLRERSQAGVTKAIFGIAACLVLVVVVFLSTLASAAVALAILVLVWARQRHEAAT